MEFIEMHFSEVKITLTGQQASDSGMFTATMFAVMCTLSTCCVYMACIFYWIPYF